MHKISDNEYEKHIKNVLLREKEKNLYILGDIQQYGLQSETVECFVEGGLVEPNCIIMRFCESYVFYSPKNDFDLNIIQDFYTGKSVRCISGKQETISIISSLWHNSYTIENRMLRIDSNTCINDSQDESVSIKRLLLSDINEIQKFYLDIPEFAERFSGTEGLSRIVEQMNNGKIFGLYEGGNIISIAALSSMTSEFAMIDNVATKKELRGRKYGEVLIGKLCCEELREGKEFLCVYCNNPYAERMYKKVGFQEIGVYSLLYFN